MASEQPSIDFNLLPYLRLNASNGIWRLRTFWVNVRHFQGTPQVIALVHAQHTMLAVSHQSF